jgi:hypothetical protein
MKTILKHTGAILLVVLITLGLASLLLGSIAIVLIPSMLHASAWWYLLTAPVGAFVFAFTLATANYLVNEAISR